MVIGLLPDHGQAERFPALVEGAFGHLDMQDVEIWIRRQRPSQVFSRLRSVSEAMINHPGMKEEPRILGS